MEITKEQMANMEAELGRLKIRVEKKIKKLKEGMGLSKKYSHRIYVGRHLHMEIGEAIGFLQSGQFENALDKFWDLTVLGIKISSVSFPIEHRTFRELRKEAILRNPEQLIKRSKLHGGGYRN